MKPATSLENKQVAVSVVLQRSSAGIDRLGRPARKPDVGDESPASRKEALEHVLIPQALRGRRRRVGGRAWRVI